MLHRKKGDYGYINKRKYGQLGLAILMGVIGLSIYGIGYVVNGFERNNICMVLGILMVLPGAKFLVTYILMFPYHSPSEEIYQSAKDAIKDKPTLLSDLVITSNERVMNLNLLYVGNACVYGLLGKDKKGTKEVQNYLTKGVRNWAGNYTVKIMDNEKSFIKALHEIADRDINKEEEKKVLAYLYSLIV